MLMDLMPKTDATELHAASTSTEQCFHDFVQQISGRALVMMESATGHHDVARDLVQESLIALHQKYLKRPVIEWTPLFYTILNHRLLDWRRQEARKSRRFGWFKTVPPQEDDALPDPLLTIEDEHNINPGDWLSQQVTLQEIQTAIARLPLRQQQAFLLRAWENLDTSTTAHIMQCSEGSVKTHYHRAILALRLHLNQLDPNALAIHHEEQPS